MKMKTNLLLVISVLMVGGILIPINYESMHNYATYGVPIKNSVVEENVGDVHYEPIKKGIHTYYASIENINLLDDESIDITFSQNDYEYSNGYRPFPEFSYTQNIRINQTFVVVCHDFTDPQTFEIFPHETKELRASYPEGLGILKYLGTVQVQDELMHKFFHITSLVKTKMPCSFPEVIEHSIDAVDLVVPERLGKENDLKINPDNWNDNRSVDN